MRNYPKTLQRVAVSAYLNTSAIQAEAQRKFDSAMADADLRMCVYCFDTTHAYVCPKCNEFDGLLTIEESKPILEENGKSLWTILTR